MGSLESITMLPALLLPTCPSLSRPWIWAGSQLHLQLGPLGNQVQVSQPGREAGAFLPVLASPLFFCNCLSLFYQAPGPSFQADWEGN